MVQIFLEEFCGVANGSWFLTKYIVDVNNRQLTTCGEASLVSILQLTLLVNVIINFWMIFAKFPRYDRAIHNMDHFYKWKIGFVVCCVFPILISIILSFFSEKKLSLPIILEEILIIIVWCAMIVVWTLSMKYQSVTRKTSLTICQCLATKGVFLLCGQRSRQFGVFSIQTLLVCVSSMFYACYGLANYYEKEEINQINGYRPLEHGALHPQADEGAGIFSKLFFCWTKNLIGKGARGELRTVDDLFELPPSLNVQNVETHFVENAPTFFSDNEKFSVYRSLLNAYGWEFLKLAVLRLCADLFTFCGPILLRFLIETLELPVATDDGIYLSLAVVFVTFMAAMFNNHFNFYVSKIGIKVRIALVTAIYDKLLRVPRAELSPSSGQIMNFVSTDVDRIVNFCNSFHQFWALPVQLCIALFLLYRQVGKAFLAGVVTAILLIPINQVITVLIGRMSEKFMHWKDQRMKCIQELVENIRTIKSSNLETLFKEKINIARENELYYLKVRKYLDAICVYLWASAPLLIQISIFTVFVWVYQMKMTAAVVYPVIALISMLLMPLNAFPWVLNGMIESYVSLKRLERFFAIKNTDFLQVYCLNDDNRSLLSLRNGSFFWDFPNIPTVADLTLEGKAGMIIGIAGDVGCGKSTVLMGLLGETRFPEDQQIGITYESSRGITYVGQDRWLSRGTIRENIVMGGEFLENHYKSILFESCLKNDLKNFPNGDQYVISENGSTLSGGQRTRVVIARALYQNTAVYLFDEPFASLDNHVARHVFHLGIKKLKQRGKLVIIASHDIIKLCETDYVIKLNQRGHVEMEGHPAQVFHNEYNDMMMATESEEFNLEETFSERVTEKEEEKQVGAVKVNVYSSYFNSMGWWLTISIIIAVTAMQLTKNGSDWWLSRWTENQNNNTSPPNLRTYFTGDYDIEELDEYHWDRSMRFLFIYATIAVSNTLFTLVRAFLFAYGGIRSAQRLHDNLLNKLLVATVSWWEKTPCGRVVNRLCSDIYTVDDNLPFVLNIFVASLFNLIGSMVISIAGIYWLVPVLIILGFFYYQIQQHYRKTTVELKRLCSLSLSPLYSHLTDSVNGLVTIRAHKYVEKYCQKLRTLLTLNLRAQYSSTAANQWLNIRLSTIAVFVVAAITIFSMLQHRFTSKIDSGLVGLAITYALSLTSLLNGLLGSFIDTEKEMVSVERIGEYIDSDNVPSETFEGTKTLVQEIKGDIDFYNVRMRYYKEAPLALDNVSFSISAGTRCAIVGRTGSGKSSIFHTLLRTSPDFDGKITIDGIDIKGMSLKTLRSLIGYIPQHPFIFNGTFHENIAVFTPNMDKNVVLNVIRIAGLENLMHRLGGLDGVIEENGGNISFGEKQLISICRVLLLKPKIVLVDEGTAYVDMVTHQKITQILNANLHHSTILSILHNKLGLEGYQRLIEMGGGRPLFIGPLREEDLAASGSYESNDYPAAGDKSFES